MSGRDAASFRSMCKLWRAALPFTKFAPVLMLPFDPESPHGAVSLYRPTDGETFTRSRPALHGKVVCGSSRGWLALVDAAASVTLLLNPFTGATADLVYGVRSIVHCHGTKFLAIGYDEEIAIVDVGHDHATPTVTRTKLQPLSPPTLICPRSYLMVDSKLHIVGTVYENSITDDHIEVYKCEDVFAKKPTWSRVKDVGDVTLFVSNNFMMGYAGASVAGPGSRRTPSTSLNH